MYTKFFGFQTKPFSITPDPRMFFENRTYDEAYANLLYGIRERKGFLLLTGEVGTGKTTILRRLMDELTPATRFVFFYNTNLTFDELLTFVCAELQLPVTTPGQLAKIAVLNGFLLDQLSKRSTVILFIDEAQNLREEVFEDLRLLSNLETAREKLLQIVLSGQPELEAKLDKPELRQLRQRIFSHSRLTPLSDDDVIAFVNRRLEAAGYHKKDLFSPRALLEVARYSKGIPRLINVICDNALLISYAESKKTVGAEIIREVARDLRLEETSEIDHARSKYQVFANGKAAINGKYSFGFQHNTLSKVASESRPAAALNKPARLVNVASAAARLPEDFVDAVTRALTEAMGPMAPYVIQQRLSRLGGPPNISRESVKSFTELLASEILDSVLRDRFRMKIASLLEA
jgi:general secretion pathway protein A